MNIAEKIQGNPNSENGPESLVEERRLLIERWRNAKEWTDPYPAGEYIDSEGNSLYAYEAGTRLYMQDDPNAPPKEVMDTCQTPWAVATVDMSFEALGNKKDVSVLERGFGMGIVASRIMEHLRLRGGKYTVIELNKGDAKYAKTAWRKKQDTISHATATSVLGSKYNGSNITIEIIEGEAYEETKKLADEGEKFDIIISDTYPLTEEERGVNDLLDLETLKLCLNPAGVFAFFAHFPGSTQEVAYNQASLITKHFKEYTTSRVTIYPPPDYEYLNRPSGPIRTLPVVVCKNPII